MKGLIYDIGLLAACLTSLSYIPQVRKASAAGAAEDLSLRTLAILGFGLALWIIYGAIKSNLVNHDGQLRRPHPSRRSGP